ncbi:conjugal transfer protein TraN [Pseudoduganella violacea]|uniref:Conjugal transfer mating pair stabilization protein TraN n=1 Tax=Pseudoduganella violacea TaxID=1715466 RepID=A0A7W5FWU6_9BURK|nr:conjugal transfer protein TraN [Pseudoduganella violacea]MBB3122167.1 conjugal transfer mating pair stabilization protein TraN [Pseudoduganella violacea]
MRRILVLVTAGCLLAGQSRAVLAQTSMDLAAARAANQVASGAVNTASASAVVPGYTTAPPETALYGRTDLANQAREHLLLCAAQPNNIACDAQRQAVASAGTARPPVTSADPQVAGAQAVARDPLQTAGDLAGLYAGCPPGAPCTPGTFCLGSQCFETSQVNDPDFAQAMSYLEAAREAGVYLDPGTMKVFSGEANTCRNRLLVNCCRTDRAGAGFSNQSLFGVGSRLVFDILMNGNNRRFLTQGVKSLLLGRGFSGSFTSYGVTVAVNGTPLPAGAVTLATGDSVAIAVTPWSLAITVVFYVAMSMMSCSQDEGKLAMKEGAALCRSIGSWCSKCIRVLGRCVACIEHSTGKCCFNSKLARILNEQGRAQLGMGWGAPQSPACGGFTVAQLQTLDFARMDLTEFYASIAPTLPNVGNVQSAAAARAPACYFGRGKC